MATAKLDIKRELSAVDNKNYDFYDNLTEDERKEFSPFILMRYVSNVKSDRETQEWFLERTHELVNKHHWQLSRDHKALLWKLYAATGVGVTCFHPYLAAGKKQKINKIERLLADLNPGMKTSDIKLWADLMTDADRQEFFDSLGFDKKQRKEYE